MRLPWSKTRNISLASKRQIPAIALIIFAVVGIGLLSSAVQRFMFKLASSQHDQKNFKTAFVLYHIVILNGYHYSKNNLGVMYLNGEGVKRNSKKAFEHFKAAADKGLMFGLHNLGSAYATGRGVEKDYTKAFEYYQKAANNGCKISLLVLSPKYRCDALYYLTLTY